MSECTKQPENGFDEFPDRSCDWPTSLGHIGQRVVDHTTGKNPENAAEAKQKRVQLNEFPELGVIENEKKRVDDNRPYWCPDHGELDCMTEKSWIRRLVSLR
jgi:hypothetical protein